MKKRTLGIFASIFAVVAIVALAFNVVTAPGNQPPLPVEVTNWPTGTAVNVWFDEYTDIDGIYSPIYNANGFSQLHILMNQYGLDTAETVHIRIYGMLWNANHTAHGSVIAERFTLSGANIQAAITIPVPSEEFWFYAYTEHVCLMSMSFYLTWA